MRNPLISIVTVSYNAVATIEETILSVINQTYSNIEYIIIDGGSTDGTVDIIKKYQDKIAYWVSEPDKGIYDAMNKGVVIATGDFLVFLGADDIFFTSKVLECIILKITSYEIVYYGDVYMTDICKIYWGKFNSVKLAIGNICHQAIFYPKGIYKANKYQLKYKVYADYIYNISIYYHVKFKYLNETIVVFNYNGFSCKTIDEEFNKNINNVILKKLGLFPLICRILYIYILKVKKYFLDY
jgi:glycosyltransferase involved in cell wall biosynthesis